MPNTTDSDLTSSVQASEAHQSAGNGAGTLVAATDCTRGFAGGLYAPFSTNDARAWAAAWMYKMDTSSTRYFNEAKEFLDAWLLEVQVSWLRSRNWDLGFRGSWTEPLHVGCGPVLATEMATCSTCYYDGAKETWPPGCWRCGRAG